MPSLTQLEYVLAVDKHRHFGKAAEACHVTQPTLSMQVQKLEEEVGYPIFDRLKKPVIATAKGQRFLTQAAVLIHEHRKLMDLSRAESGQVSGELRLGIIPTIAPYLIPLFLEPFSRQYPGVTLVIDELKTDSIVSLLREDRLDAGILATPLGEAGLKERPLYYEPFYLYVAKSHPLNARKRIGEDDLDGSDMWLLTDGHCFRNQVVRFCALKGRDEGVLKNVKFEGGTIDTLRYLIRKSPGYTLVPALFVETLGADERRDYVREIEAPVPVREVSLMYRRDQWKSDILTALENSILERLPKELRQSRKKQEVVKVV